MSKIDDVMEEEELDLTPMIDVVFQLIIFFMIVTDMTATDYIKLTLPKAKNAKKDKTPPDKKSNIIVINIQDEENEQGGKFTILLRGKPIANAKELQRVIKVEAKAAGEEPNPAAGNTTSKLKVLIRADKEVEYGAVQDVFKACSLNGVIKIALAADEPVKK